MKLREAVFLEGTCFQTCAASGLVPGPAFMCSETEGRVHSCAG